VEKPNASGLSAVVPHVNALATHTDYIVMNY